MNSDLASLGNVFENILILFSFQYRKIDSCLQSASLEQQKADENVLKLLEDHQVCFLV